MHIVAQHNENVNVPLRQKSAKWLQKKKQSLYMAHRIAEVPELHKRAGRMLWCSHIKHTYICKSCGQTHVLSGGYCRDRLCPLCEWRYSITKYSQMMQVLSALSEQFANKEIFASLLTLTCRNVPIADLRQTLVLFGKSWQAMQRLACLQQSAIIGWARNTEITRNAITGTYHPHIHLLLLWDNTDSNLNISAQVAAIRDEWERQIKADYRTIWNHKIAFSKTTTAKYITDYKSDAEAAAAEAAFYTLKSSVLLQVPIEELGLFAAAISNVKMTAYGGIIRETRRQLDLREDTIDDQINSELPFCSHCGAEMIHIVERWNSGEDSQKAQPAAGQSYDVYNDGFIPKVTGVYEVMEVSDPC